MQFRPTPSLPAFFDKLGNYRENREIRPMFLRAGAELVRNSRGVVRSGRCGYQGGVFGFSGKPPLKTEKEERAGWGPGPRVGQRLAEVSEIDVRRAANQLIWQFPEDPVLEAAQRADRAYEAGDMFNFRLWTRITKAVGQLLDKRPDGTPLN
jgi:hypothetical protein